MIVQVALMCEYSVPNFVTTQPAADAILFATMHCIPSTSN
jgi:hypothetical protein